MRFKIVHRCLIILLMLMITVACGSQPSNTSQNGQQTPESKPTENKEKMIIKVATVLPENEPINIYAKKVAESIKERTNGQVEIQVYPNSTLGSNKDTFEQALAGAAVIGNSDAGYWQDYISDFGILNGPFLVEKPEEYNKLINSDWFADISKQMESKGLKVLAFNWFFGDRHIISNKEIRTPEDLKGLKMRVPPNVMWTETIKAMGANPTELEWSEVYTGLSNGVVDAAEAPLSTLYGSKLFESAKIISMTGHFKAMTGFVIGKEYFDTLPPDIQKILVEEFQKWGTEESKAAVEQTNEWKKKLEEKGVKFVTDVDIDAFKKATQVVYTKFDKWSPNLYEKVTKLLNEK
ncbi:C4-dicarboxylate TRAP transporter substrate-binding protein [Ammoniphilus resinae]|uniref:Tripartite ATP-independent transporter DctP family solute receptor n=1 Tax=Ammoniphilus resinae TaxID=861532 RepID=A0ABS4GXT5_9BACL|nr:C4-dicarboxylate TRAP transporter substrate-binding protein [Ammoniphilus resinae]MBP1935090.1 tripartite ATP-independent transporter DctP family solute receptor [Ammoniphilus resinae]